MSIKINKNVCVGCGKCCDVCPGSLIKQDELKRAYIKYPKNCWGCTSCLKECPVYAIEFYLGADMGGTGAKMHTEENGSILNWIINLPDGKIINISVDKKESNKY